MRHRLAACALVFFLSLASLANAAEPLVSIAWVRANLGKPGLVLIDLRSGGGASRDAFVKEHIPGAVFSDYGRWRETNAAGVDGMLPPPEKIEQVIGALGIDNSTHVILIPLGRQAADVAAATRVYWTFKVMGHDAVSILDGGWLGWQREVDPQTKRPLNPTASGDAVPEAKTFKASVRQEMLIGPREVKQALDAGVPLVDYRPNDFYVGVTVSPAVKKLGTIPGAKNVQESWLTRNNGGFFRTKAQLAALYGHAGVPVQGAQVSFCNTGHWASLGWFVSSEILGNKSVRLYDGSMAEWSRDDSLPIERKFQFE